MKATEIIDAHGHENITSANRATLEITKETHLTERGDCIIAVGSDKGAKDLSRQFKKTAQDERARIEIRIEVDGEVEVINAWGSPELSFTHPTDIVVRKSDYVCSRTLAIRANKAARELSKTIIDRLRDPKQKVKIRLTVENTT